MFKIFQRLWQVTWAEQWQYRANLIMYLLYWLVSPIIYLAVWTSIASSNSHAKKPARLSACTVRETSVDGMTPPLPKSARMASGSLGQVLGSPIRSETGLNIFRSRSRLVPAAIRRP